MTIKKEATNIVLAIAFNDYHCVLCDNKIPKGHQYWQQYYDESPTNKEHTNCEVYVTKVTAR